MGRIDALHPGVDELCHTQGVQNIVLCWPGRYPLYVSPELGDRRLAGLLEIHQCGVGCAAYGGLDWKSGGLFICAHLLEVRVRSGGRRGARFALWWWSLEASWTREGFAGVVAFEPLFVAGFCVGGGQVDSHGRSVEGSV